MTRRTPHDNAWLRGSVEAAGDAFGGIVRVVEGVHQSVVRTIADVIPAAKPVDWTSGFVYSRVRDVGRLVFGVAGQAAGLAEALRPGSAAEVPQRAPLALRAALNGAFGDYLEARDNALAIDMCLCRDGRPVPIARAALRRATGRPSRRVVILLHGLCLNDLQWRRADRPDFGDRLEEDLGYTAFRLRYNGGRHISANGRDFAALMEDFVATYPVEIERLTLIGHSMGGLVARSACHYAAESEHRWLRRLGDVVCLGSPHLGAPLERLGHWFTHSLTRTRFTAPLSALGRIRSAGIKDLRYSYLRDEDWQTQNQDARRAAKPEPLPLLEHVRYYNAAATLGKSPDDPLNRWLGDLLVPVKSATVPARGSRSLPARDRDGRVFYGMNHFALIHHPDIYAAIHDWLAGKSRRQRRWPRKATAGETYVRSRG